MKLRTLAFLSAVNLFTALTISIQTFAQNTKPISRSRTDLKDQAEILDQYGKLPLRFEANHGQMDSTVKFVSRGHGYSLFLTGNEAVIALTKAAPETKQMRVLPSWKLAERQEDVATEETVLRMELAGANARPRVAGEDELPGTSNYFIGNDPTKWRTNVQTYAKVKYEGVYPGVDLVYYGNQGQLEYDFVLAPGADPSRIRLKFRGAGKLRIDDKGDLVLGGDGRQVRIQKPQVYQEASGTIKPVEGRYLMAGANTISFRLGDYDRSKTLVIDPVLVYSTYLGGSDWEAGTGIAVDSAGNAYLTGYTISTNFPTTNPLQSSYAGGGIDAFVAKLNPTGSALIYSTYLGGSGGDEGFGIAVDTSGSAYVTGYTGSTDFPTMNPLQPANNGRAVYSNAFIAKLNPTGSALIYSTYLGGSGGDEGFGIAVDSTGNAYVTGLTSSHDFPTMNPIQSANGGSVGTPQDAFVAKINPAGSALVYSTYLGGSGVEVGSGIAVDSAGSAYVTGQTDSVDFPTMNPLQATNANCHFDAFVAKFNPAGTALIYSTYLGGSGGDNQCASAANGGNSIAVDSAGNAYVTGFTVTTDFPLMNPLQPSFAGGGYDAFVVKLNPSGSALVYSTYLGGSAVDVGLGIAVDSAGDAYVTGETDSANFPTMNPLQAAIGAGYEAAFVAKLNPTGSVLVYSTYLGGSPFVKDSGDFGDGIAVDTSGSAYVTGGTVSANFPTMNPLQPANGGGYDAFVTKIASVGPRYSVCLLYDPTKAVHGGATIPIKLQLCDGSGNDLSSSSITIQAISITQISTSTSGTVENAGDSNPDNNFRFDATLGSTGGYIFNLKTTGLSTGTYSVNFTVTGDSFVYTANFEVK